MNNTPQSIADALMRLLETKPYARVTIHNICEATPISRNAFYYHFDGKEAVVRWIAQQHYLKYCLPYFKIREGNISSKSFFQYVIDHRAFYTSIYQADNGLLLRRCLGEMYNPIWAQYAAIRKMIVGNREVARDLTLTARARPVSGSFF